MRGEGAGRPGLNCCASYWPISLLKAEAFGRSKSRSPVAALPLCRRLTCAARARAAELGADCDPFMPHIYTALAEKERRMISQRTKDALRAAKARPWLAAR